MGDAFDQLHPAVQHHIVNSLGWRTLRPLQLETIGPILAGEHIVATAPTAGGKTEAAMLPLFSRMLSDDWRGLTVLYVCPLRALLNNLHDRLSRYAAFFGRTCGLWHGDIGQPERKRMLADPPDILLTTPESLESMLVSSGVDHARWFSNVRAVVIDEVHAFAGDDRGWHLLAVLERISHLVGTEIQRIALSATVGNPEELLGWLTATCTGARLVVNPPAEAGVPIEVTLDFVGSLDNAGLVISRLHRGEKRLVFVDSRSRAEELAVALRVHGVTTFVSHGSLGVSERRRAEAAFAEARDCVIVATSTLELGIDVGDLDRVIQIDAPSSVASFLQRLGRTGRRPGSVRNALFLATDDDQLLRCASLLLRWSEGFVEPVVPPPLPYHLVAQQVMALALQEHGIGRWTWSEWLGTPFVFGESCAAAVDEITEHLLTLGFLHDAEGILGISRQGEAEFGRKHFLELLAVFTSPPMFSVRHGSREIGLVPDEVLLTRSSATGGGGASALLLAGRTWAVLNVDWTRRVVDVEPSEGHGVAKWRGVGMPLSYELSTGVREVLLGARPAGVELSRRAVERLDGLREEYPWVQAATTTLVAQPNGSVRWWTFAGLTANLWLAEMVRDCRKEVAMIDDLSVILDAGTNVSEIRTRLDAVAVVDLRLPQHLLADVAKRLKFSDCLAGTRSSAVVAARLCADAAIDTISSCGLSAYVSDS